MLTRFRLLIAAVLLSGCHAYHATELDAVRPGDPLRVRVSPDAAERLAEVRLSEDRLIEGELVQQTGDGVLLDTQVAGAATRGGTRALRQRITIERADIREVELRSVDRVRTGALIGALAVGVGYVVVNQFEGGRSEDDGPGNENPESRRRPSGIRFAIPLRF